MFEAFGFDENIKQSSKNLQKQQKCLNIIDNICRQGTWAKGTGTGGRELAEGDWGKGTGAGGTRGTELELGKRKWRQG